MLLYCVMIGAGAYGWFEVSRIRRKSDKRKLLGFLIVLAATTVYAILFVLEIPFVDPFQLLRHIYGPLGEWIISR